MNPLLVSVGHGQHLLCVRDGRLWWLDRRRQAWEPVESADGLGGWVLSAAERDRVLGLYGVPS